MFAWKSAELQLMGVVAAIALPHHIKFAASGQANDVNDLGDLTALRLLVKPAEKDRP